MRRRDTLPFILALCAAPPTTQGQPAGKVYRIAWLSNSSEATQLLWPEFAVGMRERGWIEGQNFTVEHLVSDGHSERFAALQRLPAIIGFEEVAQAGVLMSYGDRVVDAVRRLPHYVDRILKGAKPADLPVEQATRFYLTINLKTAKAIGLTVPPSLLQRADKVID